MDKDIKVAKTPTHYNIYVNGIFHSSCDFMEGIDLTNALDVELSEWEVRKILDEKYGKGNWVIK